MNWTATTTGVVTKVPDTEPLTGHDRCDRCGAQAYVSVHLPTGARCCSAATTTPPTSTRSTAPLSSSVTRGTDCTDLLTPMR